MAERRDNCRVAKKLQLKSSTVHYIALPESTVYKAAPSEVLRLWSVNLVQPTHHNSLR
jgi:hypothetical protein